MIHPLPNGRVAISSGGVWRPGSYADERAAKYAARIDDASLSALQAQKGDDAISFADLQELKRQ